MPPQHRNEGQQLQDTENGRRTTGKLQETSTQFLLLLSPAVFVFQSRSFPCDAVAFAVPSRELRFAIAQFAATDAVPVTAGYAPLNFADAYFSVGRAHGACRLHVRWVR